jgi:hypothetical protein
LSHNGDFEFIRVLVVTDREKQSSDFLKGEAEKAKPRDAGGALTLTLIIVPGIADYHRREKTSLLIEPKSAMGDAEALGEIAHTLKRIRIGSSWPNAIPAHDTPDAAHTTEYNSLYRSKYAKSYRSAHADLAMRRAVKLIT